MVSILKRVDEQTQEDGSSKVILRVKARKNQERPTIGANVTETEALKANEPFSRPGIKLHGTGFVLSADEENSLGMRRHPGAGRTTSDPIETARDITDQTRGVMAIDLFDLQSEEVAARLSCRLSAGSNMR